MWHVGAWSQVCVPLPNSEQPENLVWGQQDEFRIGHTGGEASGEQWVGPEAEVGAGGTGLGIISTQSWGLGVNETVHWEGLHLGLPSQKKEEEMFEEC